jgi:WD40 repeat protein
MSKHGAEDEASRLSDSDHQLIETIDEIVTGSGLAADGPDTLPGFASVLASAAPQAGDAFRDDLLARLLSRLPAQANPAIEEAKPATASPRPATPPPDIRVDSRVPLLKRMGALLSPPRRQRAGRYVSLAAGMAGIVLMIAVFAGLAVIFAQRGVINRASQTATAVAILAQNGPPTPGAILGGVEGQPLQVANSLAPIVTMDAGPINDPNSALPMAWSPDGNTLATSAGDTVRLWDAATGKIKQSIPVPAAGIPAWSPDGKMLAVGSSEYTITLLDPTTGKTLGDLTVAATPAPTSDPANGPTEVPALSFVNSLAWSPDSKTLAAGYMGNTPRLWDAATRQQRFTLSEGSSLRDLPGNISWSPDGSLVALAGFNGVEIYDAATGQRKSSDLTFVPMPEPTAIKALATATPFNDYEYFNIQRVAWSPDWRNLATLTGGTIWVWDFARGRQLRGLKNHTGFSAFKAAWSRDGKILASVDLDSSIPAGAVILWDPATGVELRTLQSWPAPSSALSFNAEWSPAANVLATSAGSAVTLWGVPAASQPLVTPTLAGTPSGDALNLAKSIVHLRDLAPGYSDQTIWSSDGSMFATHSGSGIQVWDIASGQLLRELFVPDLVSMAWSPDNKTFAYSTTDGPIKLLEVASGKVTRTLSLDPGFKKETASNLAWSPDGQKLVSRSLAVLWLWDLSTGQARQLFSFSQMGLDGPSAQPVWSPSGRKLLIPVDNALYIWDSQVGSITTLPGRIPPTYTPPAAVPTRAPGLPTPLALSATPARDDRYTKIRGAAWSPDSASIATIGDHVLKLWRVEPNGVVERTVILDASQDGTFVEGISWSADGRLLATLFGTFAENGNPKSADIKLWDATNGAELRLLAGYSQPYLHEHGELYNLAVLWSPTSPMLALRVGKQVQLWGVNETGQTPIPETPIAAATTATTPPCGSWTIVDSPNVDDQNNLNAVSALSANDVWAVGTHNKGPTKVGTAETDPFVTGKTQTLVEHWNGKQWTVIPSPNVGSANNNLVALSALAPNDVWAVGSYGDSNDYRDKAKSRTLIMRWNGTAWAVVPSPDVPGVSNGLNGVLALSPNDAWAVGSSGGDPIEIGPDKSRTLVLHWDGKTWKQVASPDPGLYSNALNSLAAASPNDIWAVGNYISTEPQQRGGGPYALPLLMHWNGQQWTVAASPESGNYMSSIAVTRNNKAWAVGTLADEGFSEAKMLHWDGTRWTEVENPPVPRPSVDQGPPSNSLTGIAALSSTDAWAVGSYIRPDLPAYQQTDSVTLHWDGRQWTLVPSPNRDAGQPQTNQTGDGPHNRLNAVAASPSGDVWAVGSSIGTTQSPKTLIMRFTKNGCP